MANNWNVEMVDLLMELYLPCTGENVPRNTTGVKRISPDHFNRGGIVWSRCSYSDPEFWPDELIEDDVLDHKGSPVELSFPYWIMRNVHTALNQIVAG